MRAEVIKVIKTDLLVRGLSPKEQAEGYVARRITQYYSLDGVLLAEVDLFPEPTNDMEVIK